MDPITFIASSFALCDKIQAKMNTVVCNHEQFLLLKSKVGYIKEPLTQLKKMQIEKRMPCSERVLAEFYDLLKEIDEFVQHKRFQVPAKAISDPLRWLSEVYNCEEDQAQFAKFDKLISNHLQSLNLHVTVQLLDFARAAHQDTAVASAQVHSLQLHMIESKKLVWDPKRQKNKIGEGSFSTVTIGQYNKEYVAIKQVRQIDKMSATDVKTITKEAMIMQYANHVNILSLKGVHMTKGLIVMELAVCSLSDYLHQPDSLAKERARPLIAAAALPTLQWRLDVIRDVSNAIRYLHAHNILHRDIKSPNVLLFRDLRTGLTTAKVGDFGLALAVEIASRTAGATSATTVLRAVGTYSYMAPELFDREPGQRIPYSEASDVYSLGVLVNEVMSGATPWDASAREADIPNWVLNKRLRPRLWTPLSVSAAESASVQHERRVQDLVGSSDVLHCCWSHQPSQRCSAEEVYLASAEAPVVNLAQAGAPPPPPASVLSPKGSVAAFQVSTAAQKSTAQSRGNPATADGDKTPPATSMRSGGLFSFLQRPTASPPTSPQSYKHQDDPEAVERMEDFALDIIRTFPAIHSRNARVYAASLFDASIYTVRRLVQQIEENAAQGEDVYRKWAAGLKIDTFDAQDLQEPITSNKSLAKATSASLDAQHGADRLVEWLVQQVPDLPVSAKRRQIAEALCAANVTCCDRLVRRVTDVEWLVQLGVDRLDAEDIVARTKAKATEVAATPTALAVGTRESVIASFSSDLRCALPDVNALYAFTYCTSLFDKSIYTVDRLVREVRRLGRPFLKQQLQWHDFDVEDALYLFRAELESVHRPGDVSAVDKLHGVEVLSLWMLDNVPNITLSRVRMSYCRALVDHNISTVHRLIVRGCIQDWLGSLGVSVLDAKDIVAVLHPLP